ncbi:hypothetical protein MRX96_041705 [Rhipicephalus microplus]
MASQTPSRSHNSDGRGDTDNHKLWPAAGTSSTLAGGHPSKNIGAPCNLPRMAPDEYVTVIKRRQTCHLKQYRGTGNIQSSMRATISQRRVAVEKSLNLTHKYRLHRL